MILDKTLILKGVAGVGAVGAAGGTYIYREELGIVSSSKRVEERVETAEERKNREAIEKARIELMSKSRIEFMERLSNAFAWKDLIDFMEKEENKNFFLNLDPAKAADSTNKGKMEEFLKLLKGFLCALEVHNAGNGLALKVGDIVILTCLIEELKDNSSLTQDKISAVKKLFVSVHKDVKEINNYS